MAQMLGVIDSALIDPNTGLPLSREDTFPADTGNVIIHSAIVSQSVINEDWRVLAGSTQWFEDSWTYISPMTSMPAAPEETGQIRLDTSTVEEGVGIGSGESPPTISITFVRNSIGTPPNNEGVMQIRGGPALTGDQLIPVNTPLSIPADGQPHTITYPLTYTNNDGIESILIQSYKGDLRITDVVVPLSTTDRIVARSGHYIKWTPPLFTGAWDPAYANSGLTLSNNNKNLTLSELNFSSSFPHDGIVTSTSIGSGQRVYFEINIVNNGSVGTLSMGFLTNVNDVLNKPSSNFNSANQWALDGGSVLPAINNVIDIQDNGTVTPNIGERFPQNGVVMFAVDLIENKGWAGIDGEWLEESDPDNQLNQIFNFAGATELFFFAFSKGVFSPGCEINFSTNNTYSVPEGFSTIV